MTDGVNGSLTSIWLHRSQFLSQLMTWEWMRWSARRTLARRYHAEFVDLKNFKIQHELFKSVPVDMMFRYNFVPLEQHDGRLAIAVSDPSKLMVLDEISGLLGTRLVTRVATLSQITDLLKKTEQSQRVLDEASEGLAFDVLSSEGQSGREYLDRASDR